MRHGLDLACGVLLSGLLGSQRVGTRLAPEIQDTEDKQWLY